MRLGLKMVMVAAMTLAILVALAMVRGVIDERQGRRAEAVASVVAGFGGPPVLAGPVLVVPYAEEVEEDVRDAAGILHKVTRTRERQWTFFPEALVVDGELHPDTRQRGLHQNLGPRRFQGTSQQQWAGTTPVFMLDRLTAISQRSASPASPASIPAARLALPSCLRPSVRGRHPPRTERL
jgi:hypothetical protein